MHARECQTDQSFCDANHAPASATVAARLCLSLCYVCTPSQLPRCAQSCAVNQTPWVCPKPLQRPCIRHSRPRDSAHHTKSGSSSAGPGTQLLPQPWVLDPDYHNHKHAQLAPAGALSSHWGAARAAWSGVQHAVHALCEPRAGRCRPPCVCRHHLNTFFMAALKRVA